MSVGITIAIDAMSGDEGAKIVVPAALAFLQRQESLSDSLHKHQAFNIILVGRQDELGALLSGSENSSISVVHAETVVGMNDRPSHVLRKKQDSSMSIALGLVRDGKADACVSAGNTGALMMLGRSILGMYPGIDRPAITKLFPSRGGGCLVLDLGANVDSSA